MRRRNRNTELLVFWLCLPTQKAIFVWESPPEAKQDTSFFCEGWPDPDPAGPIAAPLIGKRDSLWSVKSVQKQIPGINSLSPPDPDTKTELRSPTNLGRSRNSPGVTVVGQELIKTSLWLPMTRGTSRYCTAPPLQQTPTGFINFLISSRLRQTSPEFIKLTILPKMLTVRRPVRGSHFSGLTRQVGRCMFHSFQGVGGCHVFHYHRGTCSPSSLEGVMFSKVCSPHQVMQGGGIDPVSLHCFSFFSLAFN